MVGENEGAGGGQGGAGTQANAGGAGAGGAGAVAEGSAAEGTREAGAAEDTLARLTKEELVSIVKETRSEAASRRHQLRQEELAHQGTKEKLSSLEKKQLEEQGEYKKLSEKLAAELDQERTRNSQRFIKAEVKAAAIEAGLIDHDLIALIDIAGVKFDEQSNLVGVQEAVNNFKSKKPAFFKQANGANDGAKSGTGGAGATSTASTGSGRRPEEGGAPGPKDVRKLSKDEYRQAKRAELSKLRTLGRG